jgi:hypothetical protein
MAGRPAAVDRGKVRIQRPRSSPRGPVAELSDADLISGEEVLPGFGCPVREFFA